MRNLSEQLQENLITFLDGMDQQIIDEVCNIVVNTTDTSGAHYKRIQKRGKLKKDHDVDAAKEEEELIDECDEIRKQGEGVGLSDVLVEIVR